jgi:hypothetical protein
MRRVVAALGSAVFLVLVPGSRRPCPVVDFKLSDLRQYSCARIRRICLAMLSPVRDRVRGADSAGGLRIGIRSIL